MVLLARKYRCQFCGFSVYRNKNKKGVRSPKYIMGKHYEEKHKELLSEDTDGFRFFYYTLTKKQEGSCVICHNPTDFNYNTMKYNRFCNNPKCKEIYRKERDNRMLKKYGKVYLLDDPEVQKKMLAARKISGSYKFNDGTDFGYVGSYEQDFLRYLNEELHWSSADILSPSPHIYSYEYKGEKHFYIPDFFIPSLNCEIEIKWEGMGVRNEDSANKDKIKEDLMNSMYNLFNFIKIYNKNYEEFNQLIKNEGE